MRNTMGWMAGATIAASLLLAACGDARAAMGMTQIAATEELGPVTVYYPSSSPSRPSGPTAWQLDVAENGVPMRGNGRLVLISHGTGASTWPYADQARALVEAGFVVAAPLHRADDYLDRSDAQGALSRRPAELSRTIDALAADARFAPLLTLDRVGVFGMSAGGHTALTVAGGRWSLDNFRRHCDDNLVADFQFCTGTITKLSGGWFDNVKLWLARTIIGLRFTDDTLQGHEDPRIAAVVAAVPASAIFDLASLARPRVPLGLVTAARDRWLLPRFHSDRVLKACTGCEHLADLPTGGHGAYLSPLPPVFDGVLGEMMNDPPGFDRARELPPVHAKVADFFVRHLLR
jgi:predicted dienelactone hydrolase